MSSNGEVKLWQPGDGVTCSSAKKAPVNIPCGRPVATITKPFDVMDRRTTTRTYVVCANHLPGVQPPSAIATRATKAAREQLIADHWDEYQELLSRLTNQFKEDAVAELPEELRALITSSEEATR